MKIVQLILFGKPDLAQKLSRDLAIKRHFQFTEVLSTLVQQAWLYVSLWSNIWSSFSLLAGVCSST